MMSYKSYELLRPFYYVSRALEIFRKHLPPACASLRLTPFIFSFFSPQIGKAFFWFWFSTGTLPPIYCFPVPSECDFRV